MACWSVSLFILSNLFEVYWMCFTWKLGSLNPSKASVVVIIWETKLLRSFFFCPVVFSQFRNFKIIYRRYAGLYFCICVDVTDNNLAYLEGIHNFVEVTDTHTTHDIWTQQVNYDDVLLMVWLFSGMSVNDFMENLPIYYFPLL